MALFHYAIVEEPTEQDPIKYPRLVGKTNEIESSAENCLDGEILVTTDLDVNLRYWEDAPAPVFVDDVYQQPDYSNHTRMYRVELVDGVPTVIQTTDPT